MKRCVFCLESFTPEPAYPNRCPKCGTDGEHLDVGPCGVCGSVEHDGCGFCARCGEHCTLYRDEDGDLLSECCGARGHTYDYDPT
jgi:hypothetical protein